jgi:DNA-binding transcriptional regulator YdaS (Cro superfamily)
MPDEDGKPRPDEILAHYELPEGAIRPAADSDQPSSDDEHTDRGQLGPPGDEQPVADEILAAISEHHGRTRQRGPQVAPRGSADLSPTVPRTRHHISLVPLLAVWRRSLRFGAAVSMRGTRQIAVVSALLRTALRRSRRHALMLVGVVSAVVAVIAVSPSQISNRSAPSTSTDQGAAAPLPVIEADTLAAASRRGLSWRVPPASTFKRAAGQQKVGHAPTHVAARSPATKTTPPSTTRTTTQTTTTVSQSSSTTAGAAPPSQSSSSRSTTESTSATGNRSASSSACQGAGVMAPSNCGKPGL